VDAALAGEIEFASPTAKLNVFIHTTQPVIEAQAGEMTAPGMATESQESKILMAVVPADVLSKLSELPWVNRIALDRKLRPL
jgi:hypothetical protein